MPRTTRSSALEKRTQRAQIAPGARVPVRVGQGLHLFYRRGSKGAGSWQARRWTGNAYVFAALGEADDTRTADGAIVLDYWQAFERARAWDREAATRTPGAHAAPIGRGTVGAALDNYLADYAKRGGKAVGSTRHAIERTLRPDLGHLRLDQLTSAQLRHWLQTVAGRGRSLRSAKGGEARHAAPPTDPDQVRARRASANRLYNILRAALNLAYRDGQVESDNAWRRVQPFAHVDEPRIRFLTAEEAQRLVNACTPALRHLVRVALLTGARFGELAALEVGDFDAETGTLYIAVSKSGKPRHVPLNAEGCAFVQTLVIGRAAAAPLLEREGGLHWGKNLYVRPLEQACAAAKIEPAISFHELRHTYASLLAQNGADLLTLSKLLGHSDTRVTSRHYAHLCDRTLARAVTRLPQFGPPEASNVLTVTAARRRARRPRR